MCAQGYYCLSVSVRILPWTGLLMPGSVAVPVRELSTTRQVWQVARCSTHGAARRQACGAA